MVELKKESNTLYKDKQRETYIHLSQFLVCTRGGGVQVVCLNPSFFLTFVIQSNSIHSLLELSIGLMYGLWASLSTKNNNSVIEFDFLA